MLNNPSLALFQQGTNVKLALKYDYDRLTKHKRRALLQVYCWSSGNYIGETLPVAGYRVESRTSEYKPLSKFSFQYLQI